MRYTTKDVVKITGMEARDVRRLSEKGIVTPSEVGEQERPYHYYSDEDLADFIMYTISKSLGYSTKKYLLQKKDPSLRKILLQMQIHDLKIKKEEIEREINLATYIKEFGFTILDPEDLDKLGENYTITDYLNDIKDIVSEDEVVNSNLENIMGENFSSPNISKLTESFEKIYPDYTTIAKTALDSGPDSPEAQHIVDIMVSQDLTDDDSVKQVYVILRFAAAALGQDTDISSRLIQKIKDDFPEHASDAEDYVKFVADAFNIYAENLKKNRKKETK